MDTNRLRQLRVLAETRNLRLAAEILGTSHTGLHKSMRRLAEDLGQEIFRTVGKRLELTPFGQKLVQKIPTVLAQIESLREEKAPPKVFTLGSFEVFSTYALPVITKNFKDAMVSIREYGPGKLETALLDSEIDLGVTYHPVARAGLEIYPVATVRMGLYGRVKRFENVEFEDLPFAAPAMPTAQTPTMVKGLDGWPDDKFPRRVVYAVELMESAMALVRAGLAVAYLPCFVAQLHNEAAREAFQFVPIRLPPKFSSPSKKAYIVKRQSDVENSFERQLAKGLRALRF